MTDKGSAPGRGSGAEHQSAWEAPSRPRRERDNDPDRDRGRGRDSGYNGGREPGRGPSAKGGFLTGRLSTILLITLLSLCMVTNTVYAGARALFSKINIVESKPVSETVTPPPSAEQIEIIEQNVGEDEFDTSDLIISDKDVEIILLVGADARPGEEGSRSDTIMLIAIDRIHEKVKVISIMRDLYAPLSGIKGSNKINFAYYYDSAMGHTDLRCTRGTLEQCFGVTIDHFAVVDFDMFITFINQIYPVEVEMSAAEAQYMDDNNRWHQAQHLGCREAGVYGLDGKESLYYVRMRKTGNGDYERTERQRRFLHTVLDMAKKMSYPDMVRALTAVLPYITTDLSENEIFGYCFDAAKLLGYEFVQFQLPINGAHKMGWATIGQTNVSILITNYTFLAQATQDFIYNDDMTYTVEGARASGVALPVVTTISFETTEETTTTTAAPTEPPETTTTTTSSAAPAETTTTPAADDNGGGE